MSERIDHAAEARRILSDVKPYEDQHLEVGMGSAQVHATLALVEQQRIANIIDVALLQLMSAEDGPVNILGNGEALRALYPDGPITPLSPDIAAALGVSDE